MALAEFLAELDQLSRDALAAFQAAGDAAALEAARIEFLGMKSGRLKTAQKGLGAVDKADKPTAGQRFNQLKQQIEAALEAAQARLASGAASSRGLVRASTLRCRASGRDWGICTRSRRPSRS